MSDDLAVPDASPTTPDPKRLSAPVFRRRKASEVATFDRRLHFRIVEWNGKGEESLEDVKGSKFAASLCVDGHEIGRTQPAESTRCFWNKSFDVIIPEDLNIVTAYLHQYRRGMEQIVGKVQLSKEFLLEHPSYSGRLPIEVVDRPLDITGKVNLDLELYQDSDGNWKLRVLLLAANGLSIANVFAVVTVEMNSVSGKISHEPRVFAGSHASEIRVSKPYPGTDPVWTEVFDMTMPAKPTAVDDQKLEFRRGVNPTVRLSLWQEKEAHGARTHLYCGTAIAPITHHHLKASRAKLLAEFEQRSEREEPLPEDFDASFPLSEWFTLCDRDQPPEPSGNLGNFQVRADLLELHLLVPAQYLPLSEALLQCLDADDIMETPVGALADTVKSKDILAKHLLFFYLHHNKGFTYMQRLIDSEVNAAKSAPTLFRGNSLMTKTIDAFMRLVGAQFLNSCLAPVVISTVIRGEVECEINPAVISNEAKRKENLVSITGLVDTIISSLRSNVTAVPPPLQHVFNYIVTKAFEKYQVDSVKFTSVSGFIFLRFFAPAILHPHLYGLCKMPAPPNVQRTLVLLSKTIQTLGNLGGEKGVKEEYMDELLSSFGAEYIELIQNFLAIISCKPLSNAPESMSDIALVVAASADDIVKKGYLTKRGQGKKIASVMGMAVNGLKNMKKRYFILTNGSLSYHKAPDTAALGSVRTDAITAIERVKDEAFGVPNAFQIISEDSPLYLIADSSVELHEWMESLHDVCRNNKNLQPFYHPGVLSSRGVWTCCEKKEQELQYGCRACVMSAQQKYPRVVEEVWANPVTNSERIFQFFERAITEGAISDGEGNPREDESMQHVRAVCETLNEMHERSRFKGFRPGSKYNPHPGPNIL